jgi:hypothetical protein
VAEHRGRAHADAAGLGWALALRVVAVRVPPCPRYPPPPHPILTAV